MKFPKRVKHRGRVLATIYGKSESYSLYRVAWSVNGKRRMKAFDRFGGENGANQYAEKLVKDLAKGSQSTALTSAQAIDALAAIERLQSFYQATGRRVSLLAAVSEYADAAAKLNGQTLGESVERYLGTVATVKRKDISQAVEEFLAAEEPRTKAKPGQRAQLSAKYAYFRSILLRRFAETLPNTALSDLTKSHIDSFFSNKPLSEFSAKSRNHHRAALRQLFGWAVRKDYLSPTNRLGEADGLRVEHANTAEIEFYTPKEFRALLETATGPLRAMIALGGLAGLRTAELLHLTWEDVWRAEGHVEITAGKAKTRKRRLVQMCSALQQWLEPFRDCKGKVWVGDENLTAKRNENLFHKRLSSLCEQAEVPRRENGLRHAYCSFHFARHSNENLTAAEAGNSPAMVHGHYKGLATKAEGEKWFDIFPTKATNVIPLERTAVCRSQK